MKKSILELGLFLLILLAGAALLSQGNQLATLTVRGVRDKAQAMGRWLKPVQTFFQVALPKVAAYLADALIGVAFLFALLFIHLLLVVPIQIYSIQRKLGRLEAQMESVRDEISETLPQLSEAAGRLQVRRSIDKVTIVSKPQPPWAAQRKDSS